MRKALGRRVAELRRAKDLSVPALAAKAQMDRTYLWRVEDGQSFPPVPRLMKLARALGVEVGALLGDAQQGETKH
jgi:transcriptional regulator with XRE-family HTH domain